MLHLVRRLNYRIIWSETSLRHKKTASCANTKPFLLHMQAEARMARSTDILTPVGCRSTAWTEFRREIWNCAPHLRVTKAFTAIGVRRCHQRHKSAQAGRNPAGNQNSEHGPALRLKRKHKERKMLKA